MSSNGVILTNSIEQHRSLLNSIFKFKPASLLHSFITIKTGVSKSLFTLAEVNFELYNIFYLDVTMSFIYILTILKDTIRDEGLYDEKNPSIILCSRDLEEALNMKALHVTEIRYKKIAPSVTTVG